MTNQIKELIEGKKGKKEKVKREHISFGIEVEVFDIIQDFIDKVRKETRYKISKSEIITELIKLFPLLKLNPKYITSYEDVLANFETAGKKIKKAFEENQI